MMMMMKKKKKKNDKISQVCDGGLLPTSGPLECESTRMVDDSQEVQRAPLHFQRCGRRHVEGVLGGPVPVYRHLYGLLPGESGNDEATNARKIMGQAQGIIVTSF